MSERGYFAFVGTNNIYGGRGIYTLAVDPSRPAAEIVSVTPCYNAGALALHPDGHMLYAGCEGMSFEGFADGGVHAFSIESDTGQLVKAGAQRSHGQRTCAVAVDQAGNHVYAANFYIGTLTAFPLAKDGTPLAAKYVIPPAFVQDPEPGRPKRVALHCVAPVGAHTVAAISTAEMALILFDAASGRRLASFSFEQAHARYVAVYGNVCYALMQDPGLIYALEICPEQEEPIRLIQRVSTQLTPPDGRCANSTLRISPDGRLLYVASRALGTVSVFTRQEEDGTLSLQHVISLPEKELRDIALSPDGRLLFAACQRAGSVLIYETDPEHATLGALLCSARIPSPCAIVSRAR